MKGPSVDMPVANVYVYLSEIGKKVKLGNNVLFVKANMNSDKPLQTAAIFFISNFYLKQGIG